MQQSFQVANNATQTFKIDQDAASYFIKAAATLPNISKFILVSYIGSRRQAAPWWEPSEWDKYVKEVNEGALANYYKAKIPTDELLYKVGHQNSSQAFVSLRPGSLTNEPAGEVTVGKTSHPNETSSRESVAKVIDTLFAAEGLKTSWIDMADGGLDIDSAVQKAIKECADVAEGDPVSKI